MCRCIASAASGRGVFDGNVRVGQAAQKTDAQQLSRNLLLVPRATVNVKPNLQIIADDVKCSHGCAVSDLEEDQMFYFRWAEYSCLALGVQLLHTRCVTSGYCKGSCQRLFDAAWMHDNVVELHTLWAV